LGLERDNRIRNLHSKDRKAAREAGRLEQYKKYTDFRKRVLHQAKKELDKYCDITFEVEEVRKKRKVEKLIFTILSNHKMVVGEKKVHTNSKPSKSLTKQLAVLTFAENKAYQLLVEFGMLPKTVLAELLPMLKTGGMDGFEDLFAKHILTHFKKNAQNAEPNVLYSWWVKKGVYTEGATWAKLVEELNQQRKNMETKEPVVFNNRMQARTMTQDAFRRWHEQQME